MDSSRKSRPIGGGSPIRAQRSEHGFGGPRGRAAKRAPTAATRLQPAGGTKEEDGQIAAMLDELLVTEGAAE